MKSAIFMDGNKFMDTGFRTEVEMDNAVKENYKGLFGTKTIYSNLKNKIESKTFGSSIPDGFLFDFKDDENPKFYLVELELAKHGFYGHIFPQITKFFAFFNNSESKEKLIGKIHLIITSDAKLKEEFSEYTGKKEPYKAIKDIIDNSQGILLIIDEEMPEFKEIFETYTDTWDKMVTIEILKQHAILLPSSTSNTASGKHIFTLNPDFEYIELPLYQDIDEEDTDEKSYTENFHTEGVAKNIVLIYEKIRDAMLKLDSNIKINPQKWYISLREKRNFAFITIQNKKIRIVMMLPYENGIGLIKNHMIRQLAESVQKFYNGKCFEVIIENENDLDEIMNALSEAFKQQKS